MPIWEAVVLGLVQGLAEFLPISSSGHLVLFHALFGVEESALAFDVLLHMGTLIAVLVYFREDWLRLLHAALQSLRRPEWSNPDTRLIAFLLLATVPGALAGAAFGDMVEEAFHNADQGPTVVAGALGMLGVVLLLAERLARHERKLEALTWRDALLIGIAQAMALVPGVSRSGATMTMALLLGLQRSDAARFSFLLSAPIIAGAGILNVPKIFASGSGEAPMVLAVGFLTAGVSGYLAIKFLMRYVQTRSFNVFGYYRIALALVLFGVLMF